MRKITGSYGEFWGCTGYPVCRGTVNIPDPNAPLCPDCDEPMVKRTSDRGDFWGCSNFPTCNGIRNMAGEAQERSSRGRTRGRLGRGY